MVTDKIEIGGFKTAVHKPIGDATDATSIIYTVCGLTKTMKNSPQTSGTQLLHAGLFLSNHMDHVERKRYINTKAHILFGQHLLLATHFYLIYVITNSVCY